MTRAKLVELIFKKKNFLCVGLDPDLSKIPNHLHASEDIIFEFNKAIVRSTADHCVAFKPNTAFYEAYGAKGWISLEKTVKFIRENYPEHFIIMDAKRGDIGNTSGMYAKALLQEMNCDAVTVAPYMGSDSVKPFLSIKDKWVVLLALTSNEGALDFQTAELKSGEKVFQKVIQISSSWGTKENMMYVVGATKAEMLKEIRNIIPDHFLLVPGVGTQGGSLEDVCKYGMTKECGLLVNASRSILYASSDVTFATAAQAEASSIHDQMKKFFN